MSGLNMYFCGDSHAVEFNGCLKSICRISKFQTLGGYGLSAFSDKDSSRYAPDSYQKGFDRFFSSLEKESIIFISATDADSRIGLGDRFSSKEEVLNNYRENYLKTINRIKNFNN